MAKKKKAKKISVSKKEIPVEVKTAPADKKFPVILAFAGIVLAVAAFAGVIVFKKNNDKEAKDSSLSVSTVNEEIKYEVTATPTSAPKRAGYSIPEKYKDLFKAHANREEIPKIHIEEAKVLFESGKALFVDARGVGEYNQSHIKGAVSIPAGTPPEKIKEMDSQLKGKVLVSYCHGAGCHLADKTANALFDAGYRKVIIFFGGWPEWTQANMPVEAWQPPAERAHLFADVNTLSDIKEITLDEAKYLYDLGVANFIDVDDINTFSTIRLERSHSMPYDKLDEMIPGFINFIKEKPAVIYCQADNAKALKAAEKMYTAGARKLLIFKDAIKQWEAANYPMYKNPR